MRRRGAAALALVAAASLAGGCHRETPDDMKAPGRTPADATYTTRGVVYQLPEAPGGELVVYHEAVPEFVDRKGERSGMDSMPMPFAVSEEIPLEGIEKGDKVELTFELRWKGAPTLLVTGLTELPAETDLRLGRGPADTETDPPAPEASPGSPDAADGAASKGSSEAI